MRKKNNEQPDNKERWLVSYADFITLLFAFFVVMYSVSSVNEGKYKVLSETLEGVFNASQRSITPIAIGENISYSQPSESSDASPLHAIVIAPRGGEGNIQTEVNTFREIADQFATTLDTLVTDGLVSINENDDWIEISLKEKILFTSGGTEPVYESFPVMEKIANVLKNTEYAILVEGFTDNIPIRTRSFPSNWELSAARASAIVRLLVSEGVAQTRMAAVGYGSTQPVASNETAEGRQQNRRVVILVSREKNVRVSFRAK
ncbi:MAG: flagellar motor protein MotD [Gammaproteobacteria bacterium]|nr:MAG: flagellar motor protein MotD [Pseudomonadota bacterium]PIE38084.1 MAG: flagellar motor protein MotD [Gammaproteobacteria bacterium]